MNLDANASCITIYDGNTGHKLPKDDIEKIGAIGWTAKEIAIFFEIPKECIEIELAKPDSELDYYLRRGFLKSDFEEKSNLLQSAKTGNVTAGERFDKLRREKNFEFSKLDIFGTIKDEAKFNKLQDFLTSGGTVDLSNNEALYLDALRQIESLLYHYGTRKTISLLTKKPFNLGHTKARDMCDEAVNLFYSSKNKNKKALRNKRAEMLEEMAIILKQNGKTAKDFEVAGDLIVQASKLQELDKADAQILPPEVYRKEMRIYMINPEQVGMLGIDRNEVAAQIDRLAITESSKIRLRRDALIEDVIPLNEYFDEQPTRD